MRLYDTYFVLQHSIYKPIIESLLSRKILKQRNERNRKERGFNKSTPDIFPCRIEWINQKSNLTLPPLAYHSSVFHWKRARGEDARSPRGFFSPSDETEKERGERKSLLQPCQTFLATFPRCRRRETRPSSDIPRANERPLARFFAEFDAPWNTPSPTSGPTPATDRIHACRDTSIRRKL